jgi:molybdopterin synthase sulfur carrier subunit
MAIYVKYFASLRDKLGHGEDLLVVEGEVTVAEVWSRLWPKVPLPPNTMAAINKDYADLGQWVQDGDEVAFFPPVTGG